MKLTRKIRLDPSTNSNYAEFNVKHATLDIKVHFDSKKIAGKVIYKLSAKRPNTTEIILDSSYLEIVKIWINDLPTDNYKLGARKYSALGNALSIALPTTYNDDFTLTIQFATTSQCTALQFLDREATDGKTAPYLFSQCQPIHARSMFPCFDTPAVKSSYTMLADSSYFTLMSGRLQEAKKDGKWHFEQPVPIPSYLVAIASGDIESEPIGPRSRIYSEKPGLQNCKWEFEQDTENFIKIAEKLIFEYEWLKFDALVLPSSFPYGGMENPNITFVTPTLISKDRSQVKVMAHELAHSWSGNLVTNSSWEHFWLNEGWTVYLERRILGRVAAANAKEDGRSNYEEVGEQTRHFASIIGWNALVESCKASNFTSLIWDLSNGADPDAAFSRIPYEKGFNFIFYLETILGGTKEFDPFIPHYFKQFQYKSLDSFEFIDALYDFFKKDSKKKEILDSVDWDTWLYEEGLPPVLPQFDTTLADECYKLANKWIEQSSRGNYDFSEVDIATFDSSQHVLFLETLEGKLAKSDNTVDLVGQLQRAYPFYSQSSNGEVKSRWSSLTIKFGNFSSSDESIELFANWLGTVGRMKFVRPGYRLLRDYVSEEFAISTFRRFEKSYHPICWAMVKSDLKL
ncbi:leucine aminopeptidase 2 [[Candida] railenensis]|uniref:Leukotriene A(4) hydrolase n=1 Tax=[Candida] railenensis TaxID=45579 RepID=A0A9P0VWW2_9ASCO|nr:leucine aminopeptidase 2 [[Candida] railenensis]